MGTKYATTTATQTLPSYLQGAYQNIMGQAGQTASTPYSPYTGGFTSDQQGAFENIRSLWGSSAPSFNSASNALGTAMNPTYNTVGSYMSPYTDSVVNATMANMQEQNARQQQDVIGNAISKGAMGGNRVGVAQAELARQQNLANQQTIAGIRQQGYQSALGAAQADKSAALDAAGRYAGLGQTQMDTSLNQAGAQLGAGTQQQQFDYQQYLNQLAFPYQQTGWLASIASGLAPSAGGTTTQDTPQGNIFSQLLGAGLSAASLFSDERAKEGVVPVGKAFDGQTIYRYRYKGHPQTHLGFMAQEVAGDHPEAVGQSNGLMTVDYRRATEEAAKRGEFAAGGGVMPYGNSNGTFPSYMSVSGGVPYGSSGEGGFGSYIPQVSLGGGGGKFPTIRELQEPEDPLSKYQPQMRQGADNIRSWLSPKPALRPGYNLAHGGVVGARRGYQAGGSPRTWEEQFFSDPTLPARVAEERGLAPAAVAFPWPTDEWADDEVRRAPGADTIWQTGMPEALPSLGGTQFRDAILRARAAPPRVPHVPPRTAAPVAPSGLAAAAPPTAQATGVAPAFQQGRDVPVPGAAAPPSLSTGLVPLQPTAIAPRPPVVPAIEPQGGGHVPRGIRNNNPGNIKVSEWTQSQPGYAGTDGTFAIFETPEDGRNAMVSLLGSYGRRGFDTVNEIIGRWAPANADNNPTPAYVDYVAKRVGVDPNAVLAPEQVALVADAITEFENGTQQGSVTGGSPGGPTASRASAAGTGVVPFSGGDQFTTTPTPGYSQNIGDAFESLGAGQGLNLDPAFQQSLLAAGLGMMASKSPFALAGIGEGGLAGIETWNQRQALERENAAQRAANAVSGASLARTAAEIGQIGAETERTGQTTDIERWERRYTPVGVIIVDKTSGVDPGRFYAWGEVLPDGTTATRPDGVSTEQGLQPLFSTEAPRAQIDPLLMAPETVELAVGQTRQALDAARPEAQTALATQQLLTDMEHSLAQLPENGFAAPGSNFPERINLLKGINTYFQIAGLAPVWNEAEIAAGENLNKLTTRLGFDLSRLLGSNEAASVVSAGIAAVPGGLNSKRGAEVIIASLEASNRRRIDYYNFLQNWAGNNGGSIAGADAYFNRINPPELYALSAFVPIEAMEELRADPSGNAVAEFEAVFGEGTARYVLGR